MALRRAVVVPLAVAVTASILAAWLAASLVFDASANSGSIELFQYLLFPATEADCELYADEACEGKPIATLDRALLNAIDELGDETVSVVTAEGTTWARRSDLRAWEPVEARREQFVEMLNDARLEGQDQRVRIAEAGAMAGGDVSIAIVLSDEPRWVRSEYVVRRDRVIPQGVSVRGPFDAVGATVVGFGSGCFVMLSSVATLMTAWWLRRRAS